MRVKAPRRAVATIGVFDGVHRGHRALLEAVVARAAGAGAEAVAVTFDPPPEAILAPHGRGGRLTPRAHKEELLRAAGIERLLVLPFTEELAAHGPEEFVDAVLLRELDLAGLVVGYDFRFGRAGVGDARLLEQVGAARGFWVFQVAAVDYENAPISSTRIRAALSGGDVAAAAAMLGRPFALRGGVRRGRGLGARELVPTANLELAAEQLLPAAGVYVVTAEVAGTEHGGVAHVGPAPTVGTDDERLVEVHLIDFRGDLAGRELVVRFRHWIRAARRFPDLGALRAAIAEDLRIAGQHLGGSVGRFP